ncbi:hypothetical protein EXIGLDRAFT_831111 [Exidia glandulosa HHB12029]|uniref:RRM Nup35-type domain-containing protein n=1 Tax=Exidia glandulosa HHB12029 TaxID=1314781 RepID=A0A165N0R5_EXIGL|nr:hypothetical protein EXIGLDRAFT_831111 [Exidia glandulosa HHB12029]
MQSSTSSSFSASTSWAQPQQHTTLDAFQQPRQTYQSGYLLSAVQGNPLPAQGQRFENPAPIPTKSKSHHLLPHTSSSDYGSDTLFDRSRARQNMMDEDAPPINSVADIIGQAQADPHAASKKLAGPAESPRRLGISSTRSPPPSQQQQQQTTYYVVVFGFPPEEYAQTANLFAASGETTAPQPCTHEGGNWFKIGFRSQYDFNRALRRNGELINGTYMIGVLPVDADSDVPVTGNAPRGMDMSLSPVPSGMGRSQTFASFGKQLSLNPATAAFKPAPAAQPAQRSSVIFGDGEKPKEDNSWGGKLSDMIFGW